MASIKAFVKLSRLEHGLMVALAIFTGAFVSENSAILQDKFINIALGMLSGILVEMGTFVFNDYFNIEEDRINAPHRPLVTGEIGLGEAFYFGSFTLFIGVLLNIFINFFVFALIAFTAFIGMLYNVYFKKSGILGNFLVAYSTALPFIYGALILDPHPYVPMSVILFSAIAFFAALGREIVKGIVDIKGDRKAGVRTLAIIFGLSKAALMTAVLFFIAVLLSFLLLFLVRNLWLFTAFIVPTDLIFLYSAYSIVKKPSMENAESVRRKTLVGMSLGIIGFLLGFL